jgi:hypothetical protein
MATRRDFLHIALTAPLLPASLRWHSSAGRADNLFPHTRHGVLYTVLCDERFAESVAFAEEMSGRGTPVTRFRGDITDFWYRDLSQRWKAGAVAIAGITTYGPLFCLERWGWDHELRLARLARREPAVPGLRRPDPTRSSRRILTCARIPLPRLAVQIQGCRAWSKKSKIFVMFSGLRQMTVM